MIITMLYVLYPTRVEIVDEYRLKKDGYVYVLQAHSERAYLIACSWYDRHELRTTVLISPFELGGIYVCVSETLHSPRLSIDDGAFRRWNRLFNEGVCCFSLPLPNELQRMVHGYLAGNVHVQYDVTAWLNDPRSLYLEVDEECASELLAQTNKRVFLVTQSILRSERLLRWYDCTLDCHGINNHEIVSITGTTMFFSRDWRGFVIDVIYLDDVKAVPNWCIHMQALYGTKIIRKLKYAPEQ